MNNDRKIRRFMPVIMEVAMRKRRSCREWTASWHRRLVKRNINSRTLGKLGSAGQRSVEGSNLNKQLTPVGFLPLESDDADDESCSQKAACSWFVTTLQGFHIYFVPSTLGHSFSINYVCLLKPYKIITKHWLILICESRKNMATQGHR